MNYMDYTGIVINKGSSEALASLTYNRVSGEENIYHFIFRYEDIKKFWSDFNASQIENVDIEIDDVYAIADVSISHGKENIILVWCIEDDELIHLSRCTYSKKSVISGCWIYTLCDTGYYGMKQHIYITKTAFEKTDIFVEGEILDYKLETEDHDNVNDIFKKFVEAETEAEYKRIQDSFRK